MQVKKETKKRESYHKFPARLNPIHSTLNSFDPCRPLRTQSASMLLLQRTMPLHGESNHDTSCHRTPWHGTPKHGKPIPSHGRARHAIAQTCHCTVRQGLHNNHQSSSSVLIVSLSLLQFSSPSLLPSSQ